MNCFHLPAADLHCSSPPARHQLTRNWDQFFIKHSNPHFCAFTVVTAGLFCYIMCCRITHWYGKADRRWSQRYKIRSKPTAGLKVYAWSLTSCAQFVKCVKTFPLVHSPKIATNGLFMSKIKQPHMKVWVSSMLFNIRDSSHHILTVRWKMKHTIFAKELNKLIIYYLIDFHFRLEVKEVI